MLHSRKMKKNVEIAIIVFFFLSLLFAQVFVALRADGGFAPASEYHETSLSVWIDGREY